ncbi:MAG: YdbL family protein [Alphaproteobacteria bacterium]|nr:YdbL family protein [Alphaproteobacteria bacterium]
MQKHLIVTVIFSLLIAAPAFALDLHTARSSGRVGETAEGYVRALQPSPEVNALVAEVNAKRRAEYERISRQNGQTVEVVGRLAAPQIAKGIAAGN